MKHIYTFKQFIKKPLLVALALLAMSSNAWGGAGDIKFTATAESNPTEGGYVNVTTSSSGGSYTKTSASLSQTKTSSYKAFSGYQSVSATFYYHANAKSGYTFKGWATSSTANTGTTSNPMSKTYSGKGNLLGNATFNADKYYAIFAKMTADKSSISFDETLVGVESDAVTVTVSHAHAGSITAALSGSNSGDFILSKTNIATSTTAGTATFTVKFKPKATGSRSATLTISSNNGLASISIALSGTGMSTVEPEYSCSIANEYHVDDAAINLNSLWTSTSPAAKVYSIKSFTPSGSNNSGATAPAISGTNLSLGQAGTLVLGLTQAATTGYYAGAAEKTIIIKKRNNTLYINGSASYNPTMTMDGELAIALTATNTDYSGSPISISQTDGSTIAVYNASTKKITSNCNLGVAKWTISQEENYKYVAPTAKTLTVTVAKESDPGCEITLYEDNSEKTASNIGEIDLGGVGVTLYFYIKYNGLGGTATLSTYNSETGQWTDQSVSADAFSGYKKRTISLEGKNVTKIKFGKNGGVLGTDDPYIKDIQVTRQKYFNLQDAKKVNISTLEMTNYIGGNTTSATFFVDYSTCAGTIKIASNNDHITVSPTSFNTNSKAGRKEITVTYASDEAEAINAVITAYTPYENKRIEVHAATQKKPQDLTWSTIFASETVSLPMTFACNNAATASTNLPVTYSTGNDEIIKISDDRLSFTIVGSGTTTLTATQEGDEEWQTVSETKTIVATSKKIQVISWTQNLNKAVTIGDNIPLEAKVKIYTNIATGAMELDEERTNLITYSCPANNGVVEITNDKQIRVLGYGTTTVTAKVGEDADYESAAPVTLPVRIREKRTGDCEEALAFIQEAEIEFSETGMGVNTLTRPRIAHKVEISDPAGVPDSLTFDVRGEYFTAPVINTKYFKGDIEVYESTDGGVNWSDKLTSVTGKVNDVVTSTTVKVSPNVTNLMFVRPQGGEGYHYVGNIKITSKPYIQTANTTVNLGNIASGASLHTFIGLEYSSVKGNLTVAKAVDGDAGLTVEEMIYVECGNVVEYPLEINVAPTKAGSWTNKVIVSDPKQPSLTLEITLMATVSKGSQAIVWNPSLNITTLQAPTLNAYATSGLDVDYEVTDGDDVASIVNGQVVIAKPGTFTITVTQDGDNDYKAAENLEKTFTVVKATPTLEWANAPQELACNASGTIYKAQSSSDEGAITYAITAGSNYATINATTGELTILQFGKEITIQASQAESVKFNAPEPITVDVTIAEAPEENTFTNNAGDNNWNNPANWEIGFAPIGETPNVVINGDLDIEGNNPISVGDLTINTGTTVTIKDGATLVVDGESQTREAYGNIIVEAGGQLILGNGAVNVNDFTLYSGFDGNQQPKSGQVAGQDKLSAHGHAYFILDLDPSGQASYGWYTFAVPFPVDEMRGVSRYDNGQWTAITNGVNYAVMAYHEDLRAQGQKGWKKYSGILQPGVGYTMTTECAINRYRFTKTEAGEFNTSMVQQLQASAEGETVDRGWNSLGNGTMSYITLDEEPLVQIYDHASNTYTGFNSASLTFAVGAAYFVQTAANGSELNLTSEVNGTIRRAPQREQSSNSSFCLSLNADGKLCDNLFITCDDEAEPTYTIGRDVQKMGNTTGTTVARLWTNAKGTDLCAISTTYADNQAIIPMHIFAPADGEYTLSLDSHPADDVYLTRNGVIVWDMNMGDYTFDLSAGADDSYALQVVRRVQNVATGVDAVDADNHGTIFAEKMIVNGQLFILRDGMLFDAQGKKVTNL